MSKEIQLNESEEREISGGRKVETTCYKCGKKITLNVADPPMVGYPAPFCADCLKQQQEKDEKINSGELKKVSGGASGDKDIAKNKPELSKLGLPINALRVCRQCGSGYDDPNNASDGLCPRCANPPEWKKDLKYKLKEMP